jgi:hypothetical protein
MPSKPKAHFNFNRGMSDAVSPPCGTNREFDASLPQVIHAGPRAGSAVGVGVVHRFEGALGAAAAGACTCGCCGCAIAAKPIEREIANTTMTYRISPPMETSS